MHMRSPASDHALAEEIALDALAVRQVGMCPREGQCERAHHPSCEGLLVDGAAAHGLEPAHIFVEEDLAARPGRTLEGLDLTVEILLDDAHEPRAAELVPARVQLTGVRPAQGSSRPPEHERHERARAPQLGTLQHRASGYLWREDLQRGAGRRLCNALGTHVDNRERSRTQDRCSRCSEGSQQHAPIALELATQEVGDQRKN